MLYCRLQSPLNCAAIKSPAELNRSDLSCGIKDVTESTDLVSCPSPRIIIERQLVCQGKHFRLTTILHSSGKLPLDSSQLLWRRWKNWVVVGVNGQDK